MFLSGKTTVAAEATRRLCATLGHLAPHLAENRMSFLSVRAVLFLMKNFGLREYRGRRHLLSLILSGDLPSSLFCQSRLSSARPGCRPSCPTPQGHGDIGRIACLLERGSRGTIGYAERRSLTK